MIITSRHVNDLEDDGGLLLPGDLVVVALHQQRRRDVHLAHVHLSHHHHHHHNDNNEDTIRMMRMSLIMVWMMIRDMILMMMGIQP